MSGSSKWGYDSDEGARDETVRSWVWVEQHSVSQMKLGGLQKSNGFRPFRWTCELLNEKIKALSKSMFFFYFFFFTKLHRYPTYASRET